MPIDALTVVVVHWNQSERLAASLARLDDQGVAVRTVVVDNGSRPEHLHAVRALVADLGERGVLLELGENLGFGPAANAGFRWWLDHDDGPWVALMPHDALPEPGGLARLVDVAESQERIGLISADVGDGATPVVDPYFGGITRPAAVAEGFEPADHPHGTLMLARRDVLREVGLFDERYFAYCEEADLGLRALDAGWKVGLARGVMVENPEMGPGSAAVAYLQLRNTLVLVRERSGLYHAVIRALFAVAQLGLASVAPSRRDHLHHPRARLLALADWARGRTGPPPPSLAVR